MAVDVDTNPLVELLAGAPEPARQAREALEAASRLGGIGCSPVVYAELLAFPGRHPNEVDAFLSDNFIVVHWDIPVAAWRRAGMAYQAYAARRKASGSSSGPRRILADFLIGAQAMELGALVTRDADFYRINFPGLRVIVPT